MAKFTRTAYASAPAQFLAKEIAGQAAIAGNKDLGLAYDHLHPRAGKGRKRVRITILVEPEKAPPARQRGPKRTRPVQLSIDLPSEEQVLSTLQNKGAVLHHMLQQAAGGSTP